MNSFDILMAKLKKAKEVRDTDPSKLTEAQKQLLYEKEHGATFNSLFGKKYK